MRDASLFSAQVATGVRGPREMGIAVAGGHVSHGTRVISSMLSGRGLGTQ